MARPDSHGSGPRSGAYSESRFSNWASFDPWDAEVARVYRSLRPSSHQPQIHKVATHPDFLMPLGIEDVEEVLDAGGPAARDGLMTVLLLGGTTKQLPFGKGACYGAYYPDRGLIAVHALPRHRMRVVADRPPTPAIERAILRVGGEISRQSAKVVVSLDEEAVGRFLKWEVLLHEIGHHVDRGNRKSKRKAEGFANWFATSIAVTSQ